VLRRRDDAVVSVDLGRALAQRIPNASFVELPGADNYPWSG
jgi:pimeloyl-ACP methyl ester carboxylesterase